MSCFPEIYSKTEENYLLSVKILRKGASPELSNSPVIVNHYANSLQVFFPAVGLADVLIMISHSNIKTGVTDN